MAKPIISFLTLCLITQLSFAQSGSFSGLPQVSINDRSVSLQASLFPEVYKGQSATRDLRWVRANDSDLVLFWEEFSDTTLGTLARLSGIPWIEKDFDIHLIRYFPTMGASNPLILPLGGIRRGVLIEATAQGANLKLNLIYQLAHRNLAQAERSDVEFVSWLVEHPLMQPGAYRRDNLAMLLALVTAQNIIGLDSTYDAYQSAFWKNRLPGRQVLQEHLLSEWILTPERPLAVWIGEEPYNSRLVSITRPPRRPRSSGPVRPTAYVEGLPLKGDLGFSVKTNDAGYLVVDQIDVFRLAFACGLRESDVIRRVDGSRPRNHKNLIEKILAALDEGGATIQIMRDEQTETIVIQPLDLPSLDDRDYWEYLEDSLYLESIVGDSASSTESE